MCYPSCKIRPLHFASLKEDLLRHSFILLSYHKLQITGHIHRIYTLCFKGSGRKMVDALALYCDILEETPVYLSNYCLEA